MHPASLLASQAFAATADRASAAVVAGPAAFFDLTQQVDFPAFVGSLIQGTFDANLDAIVEQTRAYVALAGGEGEGSGALRDLARFAPYRWGDDD